MMGSNFVPLEFVQEVQVKTGGFEAEYGRATGGVVNLVTKSGSNTLRGATSLYWLPRSLQERQPNALDYDSAGTLGVSRYNQSAEHSEVEANLSLGGAIVKDRLFYFAFVRYSDTDALAVWSTQAQRSTTGDPYWGGKLDWAISPSHRLESTYISDAVDVRVTGYRFDGATATTGEVVDTGSRFRGGENYVAKYSGLFTEALLLSAQAGRNRFNRTDSPDSGDVCPVAYDSRSGRRVRIGCWIDSSVGTDYDERTAFRADLDWFVGRHSLRAGADLETNESRRQRLDSGGVSYRYYVNGTRYKTVPKTTEIVRVQHQVEDGTYETGSSAAYVQDSWAVTRNLTVNFGVRWERYENTNALGERFIEISDQLAPRLGLAWDVRGDGRSKLFGSFGVYHLPMSTRASINLGSSDYEDEGWYVLDGGINADGSPVALGQQLDFIVLDDGTVADPREAVDSSFEPMSQSELVLGYEQRLGDAWTFGVRGMGRRFNQVIEDVLIDKGMWEVYARPVLRPGAPRLQRIVRPRLPPHQPRDRLHGLVRPRRRRRSRPVSPDGRAARRAGGGAHLLRARADRAPPPRGPLDAAGVVHLVALVRQLRGDGELRLQPGAAVLHQDVRRRGAHRALVGQPPQRPPPRLQALRDVRLRPRAPGRGQPLAALGQAGQRLRHAPDRPVGAVVRRQGVLQRRRAVPARLRRHHAVDLEPRPDRPLRPQAVGTSTGSCAWTPSTWSTTTRSSRSTRRPRTRRSRPTPATSCRPTSSPRAPSASASASASSPWPGLFIGFRDEGGEG